MRLIRLVSLIILIMVSLLSGTLLYGRAMAKPNELQQLGFDLCDGMPCFMGVTLGMPWAEARDILTKKKEYLPGDASSIDMRVHNIYIAVRPDETRTYIDQIDFLLWLDDPQIPLTAALTKFGIPCGVAVIVLENQVSEIEAIDINYPEIHFTAGGLSSDSSILSLTISKNSDVTQCASKKVDDFRTNPWRGLKGLPYYLVDRVP